MAARSSAAPGSKEANAKLRRELRETLQQYNALGEVLEVINSAGNIAAVFEAILEKSTRLCKAAYGMYYRYDGDKFHAVALRGVPPEFANYLREPIKPSPINALGRLLKGEPLVHLPDLRADAAFRSNEPLRVATVELGGARTYLGIPLRKNGVMIGAIGVYRREVKPFSDRQIALLKNFASQAMLAIENARLFEEVHLRSEELTEALHQQTATADVLKVISRSTFDLQIVLNTLLESAVRLCDADSAHIFLGNADGFRLEACCGFSEEYDKFMRQSNITANRGSLIGRTVFEGRIVSIPDVLDDPEYDFHDAQRLGGFRTMLGIPMLRDGITIGVLSMTRSVARPFTDKQIELVSTFADQAVIAIENVRLFEELAARTEDLRESLRQQTATADVLKVISRSTFDLRIVLQALVESAAKLSDADKATITRQRDGVFFRAEAHGFSEDFMNYVRNIPVLPERGSATGRALLEGVAVHIPDVRADPDYTFSEAQRLGDFRCILAVPMMREGVPIGVIVLTRSKPRPFTEKQIELVTSFADQAAIAIENVRLFESVEARTRELAKSLENLRAAQNRLVQTEKLASLGQLTAGIAHEIKNPLNFINNFSALSIELLGELNDVLRPAALDHKLRRDADELTAMLESNLEKVVQHGKRADSIVRNMLLHSREGSGERRSVDINAIVEDSLNLAYHGARAENQAFKIKLERSFDPEAGQADLFPQEITRVLLNLIVNGFYAATRRKANEIEGYEPALIALTRNLGDRVEISIRDNGNGIQPEVKDKMFNPFFTTKPPGEGTGLGLSLSHDIVVKQHAGSIDVDTQPGIFTEFKIILPRKAAITEQQRLT